MHRDVHDFQSGVMDKEKKRGSRFLFTTTNVHMHSQKLGRCWMIFTDVYDLLSEPYDLSECLCPFQRWLRSPSDWFVLLYLAYDIPEH